MSPRAIAVHAAIASAPWLFPFLAGCSAPVSAAPDDAGRVTPAAARGGTHLRYVTHRDRKTSEFKRVAEYFTGKPENGDDVVLPLDPASRDGHWFTFAAGLTETLPAGATAVLEVIRSDRTGPQTYTVKLPHRPASALAREYHLGLTGKEALAKGAKVTAWRLTLHDAAGRPLAAEQSYLWELPAPAR